mmetsp:Transcript_38608/g.63664  ORF Transcript_38608/g.63664 Transcript_38608/m.63664 type:complete len:89 (+) Transcript_38608:439-705(+)
MVRSLQISTGMSLPWCFSFRSGTGGTFRGSCLYWDKKRFTVLLEAGNNAVSGGQYSRLLENEFGQAVECLTGNLTEFKIAYFQGFCSR